MSHETILEKNYSRWVKFKKSLKESWDQRDPETMMVIAGGLVVAAISGVFLNEYGGTVISAIFQVPMPLT